MASRNGAKAQGDEGLSFLLCAFAPLREALSKMKQFART